jgi:catechol 2,3-dioxygenase-like lactoylglutathione lyase family enzyme
LSDEEESAMGLVKKTDHLAIISKDMDKSIRFYIDILGFEVFDRGEITSQNIKNARLRAPGDKFIVELVQFMDDREYHYGDGLIEVVALKVDDIFVAIKELKGKGVEFLQTEPIQVGPRDFFIFFRGPSGEKLEIIQNDLD